jgi:hypothetical protein
LDDSNALVLFSNVSYVRLVVIFTSSAKQLGLQNPKKNNYIGKIHIAISEIRIDSNGENGISGNFEGRWSLYWLAGFF